MANFVKVTRVTQTYYGGSVGGGTDLYVNLDRVITIQTALYQAYPASGNPADKPCTRISYSADGQDDLWVEGSPEEILRQVP